MRKAGGVSTIIGGVLQLFSALVRTETRSTQPDGLAKNPPISTPSGAPKTSVLFNDSNNIKFGYFGKLEFLDNQAAFSEVFGDKPIIIAPNIIMLQDTTSTARSLYSFEENTSWMCFCA